LPAVRPSVLSWSTFNAGVWQSKTSKNTYKNMSIKTLKDIAQLLDHEFAPRGHQFEFYKSQGNWRLTWSLTSGFQEIGRDVYKLARTSTVKKIK